MNSSATEEILALVAKPCGPTIKDRRIIYSLLDNGDIFCIDKKEIILGQLEACRKLLRYGLTELDRSLVEKEMSDLRLAMDLMS